MRLTTFHQRLHHIALFLLTNLFSKSSTEDPLCAALMLCFQLLIHNYLILIYFSSTSRSGSVPLAAYLTDSSKAALCTSNAQYPTRTTAGAAGAQAWDQGGCQGQGQVHGGGGGGDAGGRLKTYSFGRAIRSLKNVQKKILKSLHVVSGIYNHYFLSQTLLANSSERRCNLPSNKHFIIPFVLICNCTSV